MHARWIEVCCWFQVTKTCYTRFQQNRLSETSFRRVIQYDRVLRGPRAWLSVGYEGFDNGMKEKVSKLDFWALDKRQSRVLVPAEFSRAQSYTVQSPRRSSNGFPISSSHDLQIRVNSIVHPEVGSEKQNIQQTRLRGFEIRNYRIYQWKAPANLWYQLHSY